MTGPGCGIAAATVLSRLCAVTLAPVTATASPCADCVSKNQAPAVSSRVKPAISTVFKPDCALKNACACVTVCSESSPLSEQIPDCGSTLKASVGGVGTDMCNALILPEAFAARVGSSGIRIAQSKRVSGRKLNAIIKPPRRRCKRRPLGSATQTGANLTIRQSFTLKSCGLA